MRHRLNTMFWFKLAHDLNSNLIETKLPKQIPDDLFFETKDEICVLYFDLMTKHCM